MYTCHADVNTNAYAPIILNDNSERGLSKADPAPQAHSEQFGSMQRDEQATELCTIETAQSGAGMQG